METIPLIAIFLNLFLYFSYTHQSHVLDVDGNQLQANTKYYIIPAHLGGGSGGGLALSVRDDRYPCPPNVLQENDENSVGFPVKIFPIDPKQESVNSSTDVNLVFNANTVCVQRTVWRMGTVDPFTGQTYVRSNGVVGRPSEETVKNWFKIEKYGEGYKIVYCPSPSVCSWCRVECGEIGVFVENGRRWLGLNGESLEITFKKV